MKPQFIPHLEMKCLYEECFKKLLNIFEAITRTLCKKNSIQKIASVCGSENSIVACYEVSLLVARARNSNKYTTSIWC
jgi:hypothetical protein